MRRDSEAFEALLDGVYRTVRAPTSWPEIVSGIAEWLNADSALMVAPAIGNYRGAGYVMHNFDMTPIAPSYPRYAGRAEWTNRALATGRAPGVFTLDELMPPEERKTNEFYRDMVAPLGVTTALFCLATLPDEFDAPAIVLMFYRVGATAKFTMADVGRLKSLLPHLRRAIRLAFHADDPLIADELKEMLSGFGAPAMLLDGDGKVAFQNASAIHLLEGHDSLSMQDGRLRVGQDAAQSQVDQAIEAAIRRSIVLQWRPRRAIEIKRAQAPSMFAVVIPIGDDAPMLGRETRPRAMVMLLDSAWRPNAASLEMLRDYFGLTTAEIDVAADLSAGQDAKTIARKRGVALNTVQTQIKSALGKTGLSRQAALVALVERLRT